MRSWPALEHRTVFTWDPSPHHLLLHQQRIARKTYRKVEMKVTLDVAKDDNMEMKLVLEEIQLWRL